MTTNRTLMIFVFFGAFAAGTGCNKLVESLQKAQGANSAGAAAAPSASSLLPFPPVSFPLVHFPRILVNYPFR